MKKQYLYLLMFTAAGLVVISAYLITANRINLFKDNEQQALKEKEKSFYQDDIKASIFTNNPKGLQEGFVGGVKSGVKDDTVKAYAYWIAHRYVDNGGNVQEIFDFINKNPELYFLSEAEKKEPQLFEEFKKGKVKNGSVEANLINLAYMDVLYTNGYADAAMIANLSSGYSSASYSYKNKAKKTKDKDLVEKYKENSEKYFSYAKDYYQKSLVVVNEIVVNQNFSNSVDLDKVVAINHLLLADAYLILLGEKSSLERDEYFKVAISLASERAPTHEAFTVYVYLASSLMTDLNYFKNKKIEDSHIALITDLSKERPLSKFILNSKSDYLGSVYSRVYIKEVAKISPPFKLWLILNGEKNWKESDFI